MSDIHFGTFPDHARAPQYPRPPGKVSVLTTVEKKDLATRCRERWEGVQAALDKWLADTNATATQMAEKFGLKPRHYLDMMFFRQSGQHTKTNAWNAFISQKAL